jgi:hypothetical protein
VGECLKDACGLILESYKSGTDINHKLESR